MKNIKEFGQAVREKRECKGITQRQLANAIKVSVKTIEDIEKGEHTLILDEALDLKRVLEIPLSRLIDLFDENDENLIKKLSIIEYCDELGAKKLMDVIKYIKESD